LVRKRLGATALLAASAVGVLVVGQLLASKGLAWGSEFGSIGCFFLSLAAFVWSLLVPLFPVVDPFPPKEIDDAREDLARILRGQWEDEERLRGMNDPSALPVRWKVMSGAEVAMLPGQRQAPSGGSSPPRPEVGDFHEIRSKAYDQAPQGRLVILGSAGTGKSMLVIRLALELLGTRKPGDLVPVIVPAAACDPEKGLSVWVADQLVRYLPGLDAKVKTAAGKKSRKADVLADQVLPILDGLDELPDYLRAKVIDGINSVGTGRPIVVTSRLDEYRHSATSAQGRAVALALHIEVLPLETQVVQDYLGEADGRWMQVFHRLREQENAGPLEAALQSPLMVWLARTIYKSGRKPSELADWQRFPDQEAIELHLLEAFLPAVYEPQDPAADARDENAPRYRCTPQQASRWLAFLAAELDRDRRLDLEWWELDRTVRYWRPVAFALRAALVWGTALGLAGWLLQRQRDWRYAAHSLPADLDRLLLAGPAGRRIVPAVDYLVNLFAGATPGWVRPRSSVDAILARAPWHPLPSLPVLVAWIALLAASAGLVSAAFEGNRLGMKPAAVLRFTGQQGAEAARARATELLRTAAPAVALSLLSWAAACELNLPDAELERYGRTRLDPGRSAELAPLLQESPIIQRGLLGRLADEPAEVSERVLAGPLGERLDRDVLAPYPVLTEQWLVQGAARGSIPPMQAFDEVRDVRNAAHREPLVDAALLRGLWPGGCPPEQLTELLGSVTVLPEPEVQDWFLAQIGEIPPGEKITDSWLLLAQALTEHPLLAKLPEADARLIWRAARVRPLLRRARSAAARGDVEIFTELFGVYQASDDDTRHFLDRDLPTLLAKAEPLHRALRGCPEGVAVSFCAELEGRLAPARPDVPLARRVFAASVHPDVATQPGLAERLEVVFERVRECVPPVHQPAPRRAAGPVRHTPAPLPLWRTDEHSAAARLLADDRVLPAPGLRRLPGLPSWRGARDRAAVLRRHRRGQDPADVQHRHPAPAVGRGGPAQGGVRRLSH
jgi:hypothetical protein